MQFDSLADVVSFGIAPGLLAYSWGVRQSSRVWIPYARRPADRALRLVVLPRLRGVLRVAAGALQRARHGSWRIEIFRGHAHAGSGGHDRGDDSRVQVADSGLALVDRLDFSGRWRLAALMTSTIRFYSFKDLPWTRKAAVARRSFSSRLLGAAIWRWSEEVLLLIAGILHRRSA